MGVGIGSGRAERTSEGNEMSSEVGSIGGISEVGAGGDVNSVHSGEGAAAIGGGGGDGERLGEYKAGDGSDALSDDGRHLGSEDGDADGLVGSSFLTNFGDHGAVATAAGVSVGVVGGGGGGGVEGWAPMRALRAPPRSYRHNHPRIQPTHVSPRVGPSNPPQQAAPADDSGLGGVQLMSSPGGTGALDAFCSPLSEATAAAAGSEMTQAGE